MKSRIGSLLLFALVAIGCQTEYHPYDTRIEGEKNINATHISEIEQACEGKTALRFAVISDTQRWYDEAVAAVEALNQRNDLDFVIHTGDMADFGLRAEFQRQRDILNRLKVPYVALLGNHDCLATGTTIYREIFGDFDFSFTAGNVRFICLNTNSLEFDHTVSVPNLAYMENEIRNFPAGCQKSFAVMHAGPDSEQFDQGVVGAFHRHLAAMPGIQCCIHGHGHCYRVDDLYDDGINYIMCPHIEQKAYLLFTVNDQGYAFEQVFY